MRNINCSIAESIERFRPVAQAAKASRLRLRAAVSVAFGCPYQGEVPVASVVDVSARLRDLGCDEIGIADTIGVGTAGQVARVFAAVTREVPLDQLSGHFHDTYGQAIANVLASLQAGVFRFDSSIAGLGGCPYAKGATGNVATEDVVYLLHGLGIETGLDLDRLVDTGQWISAQLGRRGMSRAGNALAARTTRGGNRDDLMRIAPVPSPCISVCRMDPASGLCAGCLRTLDEIAAWGSLGDDARRAIWSAIDRRRALRADPAPRPRARTRPFGMSDSIASGAAPVLPAIAALHRARLAVGEPDPRLRPRRGGRRRHRLCQAR